MKRLTFVLFCLCFAFLANAQSYKSLWKEVEKNSIIKPRTALEYLNQITQKAEEEHNGVQWLKSQTTAIEVWGDISPDSVVPQLDRLRKQEKLNRGKDLVMDAVFAAFLSRFLENQDEYTKMAMAHVDVLAKARTKDYEPIVNIRSGGKYFNNDMLSVVGFEVGDLKTLHQYYATHGNKEAALLCALELPRKGRSTEQQLAMLDSLETLYGNCAVGAEIAIERDKLLEGTSDKYPINGITLGKRIELLDNAIKKWSGYKRTNILRQSKQELIAGYLNIEIKKNIYTSADSVRIILEHRNMQQVNLQVSKLNCPAENLDDIRLHDAEDYKGLLYKVGKQNVVNQPQYGKVYKLKEEKQYQHYHDTLSLANLPVGVYLIQISNPKKVKDIRYSLLFVSNVRGVILTSPEDKIRLVAVDANSGLPIPNAKVKVTNSGKVYDCNEKGEALIPYNEKKSKSTGEFFVYTDDDQAFPSMSNNLYRPNVEHPSTSDRVALFTDRNLYRPGQTIHVSGISYSAFRGEADKVKANSTFELTLRNAQGKEIAAISAKCDEFGTFSGDFVLPTKLVNGTFTISTRSVSCQIKVEEYKRPTFTVDFDPYKEIYHLGDTLTITGKVRTLMDEPVQNAQVNLYLQYYKSQYTYRDEKMEKDTLNLTTNEDGVFSFDLKTPSDYQRAYYSYTAKVTDIAGESHQASDNITVVKSKVKLSHNLEHERFVTRDDLDKLQVVARNYAYQVVDAPIVSYLYKNGDTSNRIQLPTKEPIEAGRYELRSYCLQDSLETSFILYEIDAKRPCVKTDDWFVQRGTSLSEDKPVIIQIGSNQDTHVIYQILSTDKVIEKGIMDLNNEINTREFIYKPEYGDGIKVQYAWYKNDKCYTHTVELPYVSSEKKLTLSWSTFRDHLIPGQKEQWTMKVTHADGTPANAQLMATMYDAALDHIYSKHHLMFIPRFYYRNIPFGSTMYLYPSYIHGNLNEKLKDYIIPSKRYSSLRLGSSLLSDYLDYPDDMMVVGYATTRASGRAMPMLMAKESVTADNAVLEEAVVLNSNEATENPEEDESDEDKALAAMPVRENLSESAFFFPALNTDEEGNVIMQFTLPESITSWRFLGMAHTKDMYVGFKEDEIIARKELMVQPNMPRFIRVGDKATITARIFNTSEKNLKGTANMLLIDPETEKVVYRKQVSFSAEKGKTVPVTFEWTPSDKDPVQPICRIIAQAGNVSDGEQHMLAVLPRKVPVMNTLSFSQHTPGTLKLDISKLFPLKSSDKTLTVEYTQNPSWMMLQALHTYAKPADESAITLAVAYYSQKLCSWILNSSPSIRPVIEKWRDEEDQASNTSQLKRNQELKNAALEETPWMVTADVETQQRQMLLELSDNEKMSQLKTETLKKLKETQNADGSWAWFHGMKGNVYITESIMEQLVRLNAMIGQQNETRDMLDRAFKYIEKEGSSSLQYLYLCSLDGRQPADKFKKESKKLIKELKKDNGGYSIYQRAISAVVMQHMGEEKMAADLAESLKQYTVYTDEMGRYYDSRRAGYSWLDYKIPAQVAAIEALQDVTPADKQTITEMQRWLLQEKRTQYWLTTLNSANAVYAFLRGQNVLQENQQPTRLLVDGKQINPVEENISGLGYIKVQVPVTTQPKSFTADKKNDGTSWGAIFAQYMQQVDDVEQNGEYLQVKREIIYNGKEAPKVGDKVKVRITLTASRDLDFVQVTDYRAACLEPVNQMSSYRWGYYTSTRDTNTLYCIDMLSKGKHVFETEYYVDREGTYRSGLVKAQCAYAPEYSATGKTYVMKVD